MSDLLVEAVDLSKCFFILKSERTTLRIIKSVLQRKSLKHRYWALQNLSFCVREGEKVAIIGKNGSGKTTLLRILTGIYDKTSGRLTMNRTPLVLFDLMAGYNPDLSVIDNIYLFGALYGVPRKIVHNHLHSIFEISELAHLKFLPFKELSSGQGRRIALTVFLHIKSDFMIIDEALASVDQGFIQKCVPYFRNLFSAEKTVIMSSHDVGFLRQHCEKAIWLDEGHIRMTGGVNEVIDSYEASFSC